jgi:hypothetical protein
MQQAWGRWRKLTMTISIAKRTRKAPRLFYEERWDEGRTYAWRQQPGRTLLRLVLILVCTLVILALVLAVPVASGGLGA